MCVRKVSKTRTSRLRLIGVGINVQNRSILGNWFASRFDKNERSRRDSAGMLVLRTLRIFSVCAKHRDCFPDRPSAGPPSAGPVSKQVSRGNILEATSLRDGVSRDVRKSEALRMRFPLVENVRTSSDIVLVISRGLQLTYGTKSKTSLFLNVFSLTRLA